jgi:hypothetical protein
LADQRGSLKVLCLADGRAVWWAVRWASLRAFSRAVKMVDWRDQ